MLVKLAMIAIGGALGSLLRYAVAGLVQRWSGDTFPVGTLVVNVVGCLAIGVFGALLAGPYIVKPDTRAFVLIGLLGAFTTFSTFGWETFELINEKQFMRAAVNVFLSNGLGLAGVWLGYRLAERWFGLGAPA